MESTEDAPADIEGSEIKEEVEEPEVKKPEVEEPEVIKATEESKKSDSDIFEDVSDDGDLFPESSESDKKPVTSASETDIFDDVSEGEDLFGSKDTKEEENREDSIFGLDNKADLFNDNQKHDEDDLAGIDNKDIFGSNTQQCDLFDDDDDDDTVESNMHGAIPVQTNSDHDRVPFNTPAVGCALDDARTTALLNAAKETTQQNLQKTDIAVANGESKKSKAKVTIAITNFTRIGDGYSSYIVYTIQTTSETSPETTVQRRFSDFIVLHQLLIENYLPRGVIVTPAPEKNFMGTAKVRFGGNNQSTEDQNQFIRRRKAALERYMNRLMGHHLICKDETLRRFLQEEDPPRPNPNASGIKGFMKNVETMVSKVTARINEVDEWYEDKQQHILELEETLKKLQVVVDNLVANRRDMATKASAFAASCLHLGEGEDNVSLRRAVTKLSELETKLETVHLEQADNDLFTFGETVKDYIAIIQSAKAAFDERVKTFSTWESAQSTLAKKREAKNKATAQGKAERVAQCEEDIKFWESKVEKCQEDFELISKNLKDEIRIFEEVWVKEIKEAVTLYFQKSIDNQKQIIGHWKEFLPEAKIIN